MQRSSRILIVVALLIAGIGIVSYARPFDVPAVPMNSGRFAHLLESVRTAFEDRNVDGIMAYVADDADMFGMDRRRFRGVLQNGFPDLGDSALKVRWSNLSAAQRGPYATCACDLTLSETTEHMVARYLQTRITLRLRRRTVTSWFGLRSEEAWQITQATSRDDLPLSDGSR